VFRWANHAWNAYNAMSLHQPMENRQRFPPRKRRFQVVIDDAAHDDESILATLTSFIPFLDRENFLYIIEDNIYVAKKIYEQFGHMFNIFEYRGSRSGIYDGFVVLEPRHWTCGYKGMTEAWMREPVDSQNALPIYFWTLQGSFILGGLERSCPYGDMLLHEDSQNAKPLYF